MFEGEIGKKMMIQQGYVPRTCTLPVAFAGPLIWSEVNAGRDVCAGCNADRRICHGRPNAVDNGHHKTTGLEAALRPDPNEPHVSDIEMATKMMVAALNGGNTNDRKM